MIEASFSFDLNSARQLRVIKINFSRMQYPKYQHVPFSIKGQLQPHDRFERLSILRYFKILDVGVSFRIVYSDAYSRKVSRSKEKKELLDFGRGRGKKDSRRFIHFLPLSVFPFLYFLVRAKSFSAETLEPLAASLAREHVVHRSAFGQQ
jgi:hypothetical protein